MVFDRLFTDTVTLIKQDGTTAEGIKAIVQSKKIFIHGHVLLIESGDFVQRKMSNGGEETYEVIDPGFHEKLHTIPAGIKWTYENWASRKPRAPSTASLTTSPEVMLESTKTHLTNQST